MRLLLVHPSALMYSEIFLRPARISPDYLANTLETIEIRATTKKSAPGCFVFAGGHSIDAPYPARPGPDAAPPPPVV